MADETPTAPSVDTAPPNPPVAPLPPDTRKPLGNREAGAALARMLRIDEPEQQPDTSDADLDAEAVAPDDAPVLGDDGRWRHPKTGAFVAPPADAEQADTGTDLSDDDWKAALPQHLRDALDRGLSAKPEPAKPAPITGLAPTPAENIGALHIRLQQLDATLLGQYSDLIERPGIDPMVVQDAVIKCAQDEPARYAAFDAAMKARQTLAGKIGEAMNRQYEADRGRSIAVLQQHVPAWSDQAVMRRDVAEIKAYAAAQIQAFGVPAHEAEARVRNVIDPVVIALARKAMLYDRQVPKQAQAVALARKRAAETPPMQAPGARTARTAPDRADLIQARERFNQHPSKETLGAVLSRTLRI